MNGIGGCVKRCVFNHVLSGKVVLSTPEEFATGSVTKSVTVPIVPISV